MEKIIFRAVIEVMGTPEEHIKKTIKEYVENLKKDKDYSVLKESFADIKKQEKEDLWATFAELEIEVQELVKITDFCFDYMPAIVEIVEPKQLTFKDADLSVFLNDMQAKLHGVDMIAKNFKAENEFLKKNMNGLMKNYVTILLRGRDGLTVEELYKMTGVDKSKLGDFLDQMIDDGKVDLKGDKYCLK
jgi:hypothetical protein